MRLQGRAVVSILLVSLVSVAMKLWSVSLSENDVCVTRIMEAAEASRVKAESEMSSKHVAYALGLCNAARMIMTDADIERLTSIHIPSYEEKLNALLYQCSRSRRVSRAGK